MAGIALAAGAAVGVGAFLTARYGPAGSSWSFRGNGAVAIYTAVPALLATGWTAAVLRHRGSTHWLRASLGAGMVGVALALADALLLPLFGVRADQMVGPFLLLALVAWTVVAPAWALVVPRDRRLSVGIAAADAAASMVGVVAGLIVTSLLLPPGS